MAGPDECPRPFGQVRPSHLSKWNKSRMKLYRYLTGPHDASFCHKVTAALNKGWQLYGSPSYAYDQSTGQMVCGQAVTKEVEGKDYDPEMKLGEQ